MLAVAAHKPALSRFQKGAVDKGSHLHDALIARLACEEVLLDNGEAQHARRLVTALCGHVPLAREEVVNLQIYPVVRRSRQLCWACNISANLHITRAMALSLHSSITLPARI